MDRVTTITADDFDGFYRAYFGDTVVATYGLTADLAEAQDIAQEAFCRAWLRWPMVSGYEDPAAWVRRVAHNMAMSRWRKIRVAASHLVRQRAGEVPPVGEDHVAIVAALRKLPAPQREAIVLHHMMDLPLAEVAEQLGAPVGTVKSWLHRSRGVLAGELAAEIRGSVAVPPASEVVKRAGRRRTRVVLTAAAVVVLVLAGVAGWQLLRPGRAMPPIVPAPTPSGMPSPDPIRSVDWTKATIDFDAAKPACPSGKVTFIPAGPGVVAPAWPGLSFLPDNIAYGDLDGDGREEAVVRMECRGVPSGSTATPEHAATVGLRNLVAVQRRGDGSLHLLGWLPEFGGLPLHRWIADRVVYVDVYGTSEKPRFGGVLGWRWNGGAFEAVDTAKRYPPFLPEGGLTVDFTATTGALRPCAGQSVPQRLSFHFDGEYLARTTDQQWELGPSLSSPLGTVVRGGPRWMELGRSGQPYLVATVSCRARGTDDASSVVLFDLIDGRWQAVAAAALSLQGGWLLVWYQNTFDVHSALMPSGDERLILVSAMSSGAASYSRLRWDGRSLTETLCPTRKSCYEK